MRVRAPSDDGRTLPPLPVQLTGHFAGGSGLASIFSCSLMYFELQGNQLSGSLPADLNGMSKLTLLDVAHNSLTGT